MKMKRKIEYYTVNALLLLEIVLFLTIPFLIWDF